MNKKVSNFIGIIISLVIVGGLVFVFFKYFLNVDNVNKPNNQTIKLTDEEINKLGKEKFQMLYSKHNYLTNNFIFFKDNNVDINNIDGQDILSSLYTFLSKEDKNITGTFNENCFLNKGIYTKDNYPDSCPMETFDKSLLEEQYYNNFDGALKINYKDFYSSSNQECFLMQSTYKCYLNSVDIISQDYLTITDYDSAKIVDNKLEVYSYLLTIRKNKSDEYQAGIYSNSSATKYIDDLSYFNGEVGDSISNQTTQELIKKYSDKITKYKSTFIKSNNNYVWHSTEII